MIANEAILQQSENEYVRQRIKARQNEKRIKDGPRNASVIDKKRRAVIYRGLLASTGNGQAAANMLERIIAGNDLTGINYLAIGSRAARSVGRINLRSAAGRVIGYGTGFLIAPGVLITNNHVFSSDIDAANGLIEFDYEYNVDGRDRPIVSFAFAPGGGQFVTDQKLDFSIVAVAPRSLDGAHAVEEFGWLPLRPKPGKAFEGEYLTIIQHPGGERKQVCVRENKLIKYLDDTIWYATDTVAGSSGSPVFNGFWEVVALHHSGVPKMRGKNKIAIDGRVWDETMGEDKLAWVANEGIRVSRIMELLQGQYGEVPVVRTALKIATADAPVSGWSSEDATSASGPAASAPSLRVDNGAITLTVPVPVTLQVGRAAPALGSGALPPPAPSATLISGLGGYEPAGMEAVVIDQTNYDKRNGYDEKFLGDDALSVPLPRLSAAQKKAAVNVPKAKRPNVLDYYNYSLVMNGKRKLAFFSIVNIDGKQRRDVGKREGDKWFVDTRIPERFQIVDAFYAGVKRPKLVKGKKMRVFDRGHLVRRLDSTWGPSESTAKRNGDDTFHFTNCSPQHVEFNEGHLLWAGIEDYVLAHAQNDKCRATVINGPIFGTKDDKALGVMIPQQFFKIAVFAKGDALAAAGFVLSQAELLDRDLPEEALRPLTADQAHAFQFKIAKIAQMTGLNFGSLGSHDVAASAFEDAMIAQPLSSLGDIRI